MWILEYGNLTFVSVLYEKALAVFVLLFCRFSVTKMGNNHRGGFHFLVDSEWVYWIHAKEISGVAYPQGVATINLYLRAGQVAQVENYASSIVYGIDNGAMHSWFTGFMLSAF